MRAHREASHLIVAVATFAPPIRRAPARWPVFVLACIGIANWLPAIGARAAQGGKAEPIRIQFQPGRTGATVTGALRGDAQSEYAFVARKGQWLTITPAVVPARSLVVTVRAPSGVELPLRIHSGNRMSMVLPSDGDYEMWVRRVTATPGRSVYRLTLTIRSPAAAGGPAQGP